MAVCARVMLAFTAGFFGSWSMACSPAATDGADEPRAVDSSLPPLVPSASSPAGSAGAFSAHAPRLAPLVPRIEDPGAREFLTGKWAQAATELGPVDPRSLTVLALDDTARGEARGLVRVGNVLSAHLNEGATASKTLELEADACVTLIAHAGLGLIEVDAAIGLQAGVEPLAVEYSEGQVAVVGGRFGCVEITGDRKLRLVVGARKGKGPVVVALFSRPLSE